MSIEIKPFESKHFNTIVELALDNYHRERTRTTALYGNIDRSYFYNNLQELISKGVVNIAFENSDVVGFLAFENSESSTNSPLYGYGINHKRRGEVISKLFQSSASILCEKYIQHFWVNIYAHDSEVLWTYIISAFVMDTTNVIRDTNVPIESNKFNYTFKEINKEELLTYKHDVIELYRSLINHLRVSPVFYHCKYFLPIEDRFEVFLSDNIRVFSVFDGNRLIGMVNAEPPDNDFAINDIEAMSLGDLFIAPAYRRNGIGVALLEYANNELKKGGINRIFVTHGTINPTARSFWDRYFMNYSYTMTREIDPDMLGVIKPV